MFSLLKGLRRAPDAPEAPPDRRSILVVEDEEVMQRFYSCFFEKLHAEEFSWRLAKDGAEALQALAGEPPDLVLLDWMLPAVPGPAVLKAIRAHPRTRGAGVLVVTAKSAPNDTALALEAGADDYLCKPFDERVLLARLRSLARRQQALRAVEAQLRQSQKLETIGLLAGGVAHDFNNMLTAIKGFADFLVRSLEPGTAQRDDAEEILKAADQAASLTRQLLAFGHKQPQGPVVCDLNQTVQDMAKMLRRLLGEDISLTTTLDPALGLLRAAPGQLVQVIANLAVNARDAMPQGGRLAIATAEAALPPEFFQAHPDLRPGPYVLLSVSDSGQGMDAGVLPRIFEPFFTTQDRGRGTGLGLSLVRDIVRQHGGEILVHSEPGAGSRFEVYLPRAEQAERPAAAPSAGRPSPGTETVLLVEDDEMVRRLACRMLQAGGYRVLAARDADEAVRRLQEAGETAHLLLADVVLPGLDGRELARRLLARLPGLKVLFISGYNDDTLLRHGVRGSDAALLLKPFTQETLTAKVREVLDSHGASDDRGTS
ncbi:MAG: response regulator [Elusimicrobia bacterium]|nr:response regulator [Elusimicrobiota bacterium]